MWITLPILKNSWTGEVEERDLNMAHCITVMPYVFVEELPDEQVERYMDQQARADRAESRAHYNAAYGTMKTEFRIAVGTEAFIWHSPRDMIEVRRLMLKAQRLSITPNE